MNGYHQTDSGLLVPKPAPPAGLLALMQRVADAVGVSGLVDVEETAELLVGLDVAIRHPEWARALVEALNGYASEEQLSTSEALIRAFVEACPVTFEHEPEAST